MIKRETGTMSPMLLKTNIIQVQYVGAGHGWWSWKVIMNVKVKDSHKLKQGVVETVQFH